jgi:hypothetical protein
MDMPDAATASVNNAAVHRTERSHSPDEFAIADAADEAFEAFSQQQAASQKASQDLASARQSGTRGETGAGNPNHTLNTNAAANSTNRNSDSNSNINITSPIRRPAASPAAQTGSSKARRVSAEATAGGASRAGAGAQRIAPSWSSAGSGVRTTPQSPSARGDSGGGRAAGGQRTPHTSPLQRASDHRSPSVEISQARCLVMCQHCFYVWVVGCWFFFPRIEHVREGIVSHALLA